MTAALGADGPVSRPAAGRASGGGGGGVFARLLRERAAGARRTLAEAEADGDDYLVSVATGELESLQRTADDHGIDLGS